MSENIELHSFRMNTTTKDSDIEEYHEISEDLLESTFSSKYTAKPSNDYDFFTSQDVKIDEKKKKKHKMKERSSNLMDIINTELASIAVPIAENVISRVDYSKEPQSRYLKRTPRIRNTFQKSRPRYQDSENGWGQKIDSVDLKPVYPKVLENTVTEVQNIPVQYVKPVVYNDLIAENIDSGMNQSTKFLDIELKNIKFLHHHQFSMENLLNVKLIESYTEYNSIQQLVKEISRDIRVIRQTRDSLKEEFLKISPNKKEDIRFDQTVRKYSGKLIKLKENYLETLQQQKEVMHKITSLWSDIEMIRDKKGCKETTSILEIKKDTLDQDEYDEKWNEIYNIEFNDMLDKMEYEYVNKYIEYKEAKNTQNLDDSAKRRISKPRLQIDEDAVKKEVEKMVNNIVTRHEIEVILKQNIYTDINKSLISTSMKKYCFEIYVDDLFVCESEHYSTKNDIVSDIEFTELFSVQILPRNTTLVIVLSENDREISSIRMNLAEITKNNCAADFVAEHFVSNDIIEPNFGTVGSGHNIKEIAAENKVRLKSSNMFQGNLYSTCEVNIKMGWNDKLSQNDSEAIKSSMEIGRQLKRLLHGVDKPNIIVLRDIIGKIYGKDVSNDENMIDTLRNVCKTDVKSEDSFPIDENSHEFVRLKLLHLRNTGGFTNIDNKLIPVHASQISTEQLNCLQKSDESEFEVQYYSDKYAKMDPIELQRFIGSKYVQKLNANMLRNLNEHLMRKTYKDVVRDFKDLSLRALFTNQHSLATLANISTSTKQKLLSEGVSKEQEIRVTVVRAYNLPDRSAAVLDEDDDEQIAGFKVHPLRPLVRVSYHAAAAQTATAIGCHPTWNHTLSFKTRLEPVSSLHVDVFDEVRAHAAGGAVDGAGGGYTCSEQWLGALRVPLHAVLSAGTLRGTFKISSPPMLFGYEHQPKQNVHSLIPEVTQLLKKDASFISLHVTTSLSHLGGLHDYHQPTNSDDDYLIRHLNTFVTEYVNNFPSRNISLTFIDSSGKNRCVTQFLQPLPLPDHECFPKNPKGQRTESALSKSSVSKSSSSRSSGRREEENQSGGEEREGSWRSGESLLSDLMDASLRYVSLIPTYDAPEPYAVTLMGLELLKVLRGRGVDHCALLASYWLRLGVRCWVAVGAGARGRGAYVLAQRHLRTRGPVLVGEQAARRGGAARALAWHVYCAASGARAELRDAACPLKTVHYVFDNDNIWVNIQPSQDCESVSFDFANTSHWQPVFDKTVFVMRQPIVNDAGLYSPPCDVTRLRHALEAKVRDKVQKWRPHAHTVWNRYCSGLLREMLPHWEYWALRPSQPKPAPSQRLKQLMHTYKVFGFPLNVPYAGAASVCARVKATRAHLQPAAELALAVELYAYPNNVLSCWVFLATITRL